jgi:hypothetical protein
LVGVLSKEKKKFKEIGSKQYKSILKLSYRRDNQIVWKYTKIRLLRHLAVQFLAFLDWRVSKEKFSEVISMF